ncbi:MAG: Heavy metal transport/detoxification protein [Berkelbacteria bacterium GW2011_GWA2_38_9]|uniref:Heavy metal transport/detoxification protein n=1 Tax=Berkelbacteria bacterium GW2011_GWA2_38_9 TaxID=1618334 RepID=A0A0G0L324_9BACT|nr:MAG: Heavy metal transport/detoxification protein [Berkelbacteria bacterium GW2011_GWA2_38_9]
MPNHKFHIHGMHCASCVVLIKPDGYSLSLESEQTRRKWSDVLIALPIAAIVIIGFLLLQKIGWINLINSNKVGPITALIVGLVASISTCLAIVGGLVLSISANYSKIGQTWRPQAFFHIGRLVGFFILGGLIGLIGSKMQLGLTGNFILNLAVGLVMIILGINLLDLFHWTKKLQITMPKSFSKLTKKTSNSSHYLAPLLIGVLTFFLPCGFTQSMQVYSLSTGNFWQGSLTMFFFALGTFPILALLSFGMYNIGNKQFSGIIFKTAGLVVIAFAVFNILNGLVARGIIEPFLNL